MKLRFKTFKPSRLAAFRSSYPFLESQWEKKGLSGKFNSMLWVKIPAFSSESELVQLIRRSIYPWARSVGRSRRQFPAAKFGLPEIWFFHRSDGQIFGFGDIYNYEDWDEVRRVVFAPSPFDVVASCAPACSSWSTVFKLSTDFGHLMAIWSPDKVLEKSGFSYCIMSKNLL